MNNALLLQLRTLVFFAALPVTTFCAAQSPASSAALTPVATPASEVTFLSGRPDQIIQRIRTEDAGVRIDEVRVGGETQSITVQPKTGFSLPAYEVKPSDTARGSAPSSAKNDTTGSSVWNVLKF